MSGSGWFLRLPPPTASADEAVPTRPSPEQPCRDSPLQRSGLLERPRWGSSASSLRAPAPPGPAAPRSGRPRATAAGRPGPRPLPRPRARGQAAVGGGAAPERASEAPPRQFGPRARRGRARAHGGLPAPLRARPAGGQRGGPSPPALRGDAAEARRPGSRPADAARGLPRCAFGPFVPESCLASGSEPRRRAVRALWRRCRRREAWPASPRAPLRPVPGALREIFKAPQYWARDQVLGWRLARPQPVPAPSLPLLAFLLYFVTLWLPFQGSV